MTDLSRLHKTAFEPPLSVGSFVILISDFYSCKTAINAYCVGFLRMISALGRTLFSTGHSVYSQMSIHSAFTCSAGSEKKSKTVKARHGKLACRPNAPGG